MSCDPTKLFLTGIMYPGQKTHREGAVPLGEQCEEFSVHELANMVSDLEGLPVWVEHDASKLVGKVLSARKTHSNSVEVKAVVEASTAAGRVAIDDILKKKMIGLSLSHSYALDAPPDSSTAQSIRIAVCDGKDWRADNTSTGHSVRKTLRELSVCADPAREGCLIHDIVCASQKNQSQPTINTNCPPRHADLQKELDTSVVGVFACSNSATQSTSNNSNPSVITMSDAAPTSTEAPQTATEQAPPQPAEVKPPEAGEQIPPKQQNVAKPDQARGPDGRFKEKDDAKESPSKEEAKPTDTTDTKQPLEDDAKKAQAQVEQTKMMEQAAERIKELGQQLDEMQKQTKALQDKAEAEKTQAAKERAELQQQKDAAVLKAQTAARKELDTATEKSEQALNALRHTLASVGAPVPDMVQEEKGDAEQDPHAKAKQKVTASTDLTIQAIKQINLFKEQADQAMNSNDSLKRSLTGFAGDALPQQRLGQVNASAQGDTKRARTEPAQEQPSDFLEWRKQHPNALLNEVNHNFKLMMEQSSASMSGVVNASRTGQPWTASSLQFQEQRNPYQCVHAGALHPELFQGICNMNTGRMPSDSDSEKMCKNLMDTLAQRHRY